MSRPLSTIAAEIKKDWKHVSPYAQPYLAAMQELNSLKDMYYCDTAVSVTVYFLANAATWKGDVARRIKRELNDMVATVRGI